jgi:hypothetical protein
MKSTLVTFNELLSILPENGLRSALQAGHPNFPFLGFSSSQIPVNIEVQSVAG